MSMEINGSYRQYDSNYTERLRFEQHSKAEGMQKEEAGTQPVSAAIQKDEYISSKESGRKPSGLYSLGQDEQGNPRILYDDPKKPVGADKDDRSEKNSERCTYNTDSVDREIQKLKDEKKQLEQQIRAACGNEEKVRELEKKLMQLENELAQKDNDAYRRQHAAAVNEKEAI